MAVSRTHHASLAQPFLLSFQSSSTGLGDRKRASFGSELTFDIS